VVESCKKNIYIKGKGKVGPSDEKTGFHSNSSIDWTDNPSTAVTTLRAKPEKKREGEISVEEELSD